tara:strand:+ start:12644 stop:13462 length:819 start_codon:yes stop_codon:yes gene_type:complete
MSIRKSKDENDVSNKEELETGDVLHLTKAELFEVVQKLSKENNYPKSKTDSLLENMLEEMRAVNERDNKLVGVRSYSEEEIDVEDYLETPAMFYCYSFSHICIGDTRFGHSVNTPYKRPVRFKPLYRYKKPGTSRYNEEIVSMSCCIVRSKKEADWIRNHTLYGIRYFENTKDVQTIDRVFADRLVEMSNMLNGMSQFEVIERAKQEGVEVNADVDDVRKRLSYNLAEKAMKSVKTKTHHKIAAADESFNPNNPDSIKEVLLNDGELDKVPM